MDGAGGYLRQSGQLPLQFLLQARNACHCCRLFLVLSPLFNIDINPCRYFDVCSFPADSYGKVRLPMGLLCVKTDHNTLIEKTVKLRTSRLISMQYEHRSLKMVSWPFLRCRCRASWTAKSPWNSCWATKERRYCSAARWRNWGLHQEPQGPILYWCLTESEICLNSEGELVYEDLLKSREVVLLIEDKHSLLIVHWIYRTEGYRAVLVRNQDGIAGDAGSALVAVGEWLDVGKEHQGKKGFPKGAFYLRLKYTKNTAQIPKIWADNHTFERLIEPNRGSIHFQRFSIQSQKRFTSGLR